MPPNLKGGKGYKKSKHTSGEEVAFVEPESDQIFARVTKMLGGNNLQAYCNDDVVRVCNIRGSMRKRVWINVGDIILISLREDAGIGTKADVVTKYDAKFIGKIKKRDDFNMNLMRSMENSDGTKLGELRADEDIFEHDDEGEGEGAEVDGELRDSDIDEI